VLLGLRNFRRLDITQAMILAVFGYAALRYGRVQGVSAIVLVPIIASMIIGNMLNIKHRVEYALQNATLILAAVFIFSYSYILKFRFPLLTDITQDSYAFDYSVQENYYPAGAVRFSREINLTGNFYNSGNFGGYLSFYAAPDRRIFQYNMPPIFGDTYRFGNHPEELAKWDINYAFVSRDFELNILFPAWQWARIYREVGAILVVKRTPQNQALINLYELQYFTPQYDDDQLNALVRNAAILPRVAFEMGVYLAYRSDERIARLWEDILTNHPALRNNPDIRQLLEKALKYNNKGHLAHIM
jgi:hypothetical protein